SVLLRKKDRFFFTIICLKSLRALFSTGSSPRQDINAAINIRDEGLRILRRERGVIVSWVEVTKPNLHNFVR
ncbi:MAG: hypothetical protein MUD14_06160, partial [Hydrococcus sp. Prado102]|nr:hypothetical protein [Hydrococcus sp. Prado102]